MKRALCFLVAITLCFSLNLANFAYAYYGNERMSAGDAEVVEAVMLNLFDYAVRVLEEQTDIVLDYSNPDELFLDLTIEATLLTVPGYGPALCIFYSYGKMTAEALWDLGLALDDAVIAGRELMESSFNLAAERQELLIGSAYSAYQIAMVDYVNGTVRTETEIETSFGLGQSIRPTSEVVQNIRDNADSLVFLLNRKNAGRIEAVADALEQFASKVPSAVEAYNMGYAVAEAIGTANSGTSETLAQRQERLLAEIYTSIYPTADTKSAPAYFTVNGTYCTHEDHSIESAACKNCHLGSILQMLNDKDTEKFGAAYQLYQEKPMDGRTCVAFQWFVWLYVYGAREWETSESTVILNKQPANYSNFDLLQPGDTVDYYQNGSFYHAAIFLKCDENTVTLLDCNWTDSGTYNHTIVRQRTVSYSSLATYAFTAKRANNASVENEETGDSENPEIPGTKTQYRYHMYVNEDGKRFVCPYAGQEKYPGTTFSLVYTDWLDEPLTVNNGNYTAYVHSKTSHCESYGCIDPSWEGNRYMDADGNTWVCEETRTTPINCDHVYDNDCDSICNICSEERITNHSYDEGFVTKEPTCAEGGALTYTCTICGSTMTETISKSDVHTYDNGTVTTAPTCTTEGLMTYICIHCGHSHSEIITFIPHNFVNGTCTDCGETEVRKGDVNGDGKINTTDAKLIMQYELKLIDETMLYMGAADVNGDGKADTTDAKLIMQIELGIINEENVTSDMGLLQYIGMDVEELIAVFGTNYSEGFLSGGYFYQYEEQGILFFLSDWRFDAVTDKIVVDGVVCGIIATTDVHCGYGLSGKMTYAEIKEAVEPYISDLDEPYFDYNEIYNYYYYGLRFSLNGFDYYFEWENDPNENESECLQVFTVLS